MKNYAIILPLNSQPPLGPLSLCQYSRLKSGGREDIQYASKKYVFIQNLEETLVKDTSGAPN